MTAPSAGTIQPTRTPGDEAKGRTAPEVSVTERRDVTIMHAIEGEKPGWHYRWVRNDASGVTKARMKGYIPVLAADKEDAKPLIPFDNRADGRIAVGDTVLMRCPEAMYQNHRQDLFARGEEMLSAVDSDVKSIAESKGVKLISTEPK